MPTIEELENLINDRLSPGALLERVAEKPLVDSREERFRDVAGFIDLTPTPGREDRFHELKRSDRVIYWKQAENDLGVEIVGVVWSEKGESKVFCGTILPP